jgi:histidinol-phosphate aminotransferase
VLAGRVREIVATRDRFVRRIAELPGLTVFPTSANFVLIRCGGAPAQVVFTRLYEGHGILVRDVSGASELAECLRISVGTPEDMEAVVVALEQILGG